MELVKNTFDDRVSEIETFFELVAKLEVATGEGAANFQVSGLTYNIKPEQQKIMYSSIYLLLYNLVESTISTLIEAVERHSVSGINNDLKKLTVHMRSLYVKAITCPSEPLSYEKRLEKALELFEQVSKIKPITMTIPPGGGGNWDTTEIKKFSKSLGIDLKPSRSLSTKVNKPFKNDKGPIRLVKELRNKLAHGSISFTECGSDVVSSDFRELIDIVKAYLTFVINEYEKFLTEKRFMAS